jgi:hypothetical protein
MDLNFLYQRQQVSRMRADLAGSDASRDAHASLAKVYGDQIQRCWTDRNRSPHPYEEAWQ